MIFAVGCCFCYCKSNAQLCTHRICLWATNAYRIDRFPYVDMTMLLTNNHTIYSADKFLYASWGTRITLNQIFVFFEGRADGILRVGSWINSWPSTCGIWARLNRTQLATNHLACILGCFSVRAAQSRKRSIRYVEYLTVSVITNKYLTHTRACDLMMCKQTC